MSKVDYVAQQRNASQDLPSGCLNGVELTENSMVSSTLIPKTSNSFRDQPNDQCITVWIGRECVYCVYEVVSCE